MKKLSIIPAVLAFAMLLFSCDDFFERDISGETIDIITPSDDAIVQQGDVTFNWNVLDGAIRYRLIVVSPSFEKASSSICDLLIVPDSAAVSCTHTLALQKGNYQWTVQGLNSESTTPRSTYNLTVFDPDDPDGL